MAKSSKVGNMPRKWQGQQRWATCQENGKVSKGGQHAKKMAKSAKYYYQNTTKPKQGSTKANTWNIFLTGTSLAPFQTPNPPFQTPIHHSRTLNHHSRPPIHHSRPPNCHSRPQIAILYPKSAILTAILSTFGRLYCGWQPVAATLKAVCKILFFRKTNTNTNLAIVEHINSH